MWHRHGIARKARQIPLFLAWFRWVYGVWDRHGLARVLEFDWCVHMWYISPAYLLLVKFLYRQP